MSVASLGIGMLLFLSPVSGGARAPGAAQTGKPEQQVQERNKLAKQVDELRQAGKFDEAVPVAERALEFERGAGAKTSAEVAAVLSRLAELHELKGDWGRALARRKEALAARKRVDGKDHWRTADARLAVAFAEKVAGLEATERAKVQAALGKEEESARLDAQGKFAESERAAMGALEAYRALVGPESAAVARTWHRIGRCRSARHDAGGAKEANEQALAIRRKSLPPNHPDIARSLGNLGVVQAELREYAAAKQSFEQVLAIFRKSLPPNHPDIATSLNNLGVVQSELREYAAAKQSFEQALAIRRQSLPPDHPEIADSLTSLGNVQSELRMYAAAKQSQEEALAIRRKALPPDHPDIAQSLNNLGNVQSELRMYAAAKQSQEEALAIRRQSLPPDHPDIAFSLLNLALQGLKSGVGVGDAVPRLAEATGLFQAEQLRLAVAQAEQEQLATAAMAKSSLGALLYATLITSAEPASAYDRVVRVKGSVTAQQRWARQARVAADPDTTRLLDRLRRVTRRIVGLSMDNRPAQSKSDPRDVPEEIRTLSAERDDLERQLTERSAVYRTIQARALVGSGEVRTVLPEGSALIDLVDYSHLEPPAKGQTEPSEEQRMVAFVVRPERQKVVIVPLGPSQALAKWIDRWRASYGAGKAPPAGETDPGAELRKRLWEPLAVHLEGVKVVLVSPDGPLHGLPWAALPGSQPDTYLVHEHAFAVVPVPQLLPELLQSPPRRDKEPPSLLLAGGIDFGQDNSREEETPAGKLPPVPLYRPLPGTGSEVNDLYLQFTDRFPDVPAP